MSLKKFLRPPAGIFRSLLAVALLAAAWNEAAGSESFFPARPEDPLAVDFTNAEFGAHADGRGDDAPALQQAIDHVAATTHAGIVFIPSGRYRLGKTVFVWQGIRLIGYGASRPVFVLGRDTPGFQEGAGRYMIHFADNRPRPGEPFVDGSEFTFYSGMSNIDFELEDGNPAAVAVRFHVAQHGRLTHMDFRVGAARAALEDVGNQASDIHVHGGDYGIITKRTAPVWQFLLMDSSFDGQRVAAIHTQEAGFTLVRVNFRDMPVALEIAPGQVEQLYGRDLRMENIREAAFVPGNARSPHSAVTLTNVACADVPRFCGGERPVLAPAKDYVVDRFSLGLDIGEDGRERGIALQHEEHPLTQPATVVASDIPDLPPMERWVNVHALGVNGDGETDDTAALRSAIARHRVLYFPTGTYRVTASLELEPDTVLIGLNPGTTRIVLANGTPAFAGEGGPMGVIVTPRGGRNIVESISVWPGLGNARAAGVIWMAGPASLLDDVCFPAFIFPLGWHPGMPLGGGARWARDGRNHVTRSADLVITNGGGGIFRGNWPHAVDAAVGLRIEDTSTPGKIYQMSVEHHERAETEFHHVRNWEVYDLQTEEENPAGANAYAADIENARDLLFANTYLYRVSRSVRPKTDAIRVCRSDGVRFENVKVFSQTRLAFDNAILNEDNGASVRARFFAGFGGRAGAQAPAVAPPAAVFGRGAKLEGLATGFSNASGLAVTGDGVVFFTDAAEHKIYRWNEAARKAELWAEIDGQPQVLGFVPPSHLLAITNEKAVYQLDTAQPGAAGIVAEAAASAPATVLLLPVGLHNQLSVLSDLIEHRGHVYRPHSNTAVISVVTDEHRGYYYAPGTTTAVLGGGTWRPNLQSSTLAAFAPGDTRYVTSEDDGRTYRATLRDGRVLETTVFAERGGTSVATDADGNVFIASGQVWVYDRDGKQIGALEVPERPGSLAFGGKDGRTLFIGARSSLYAIRTQAAGKP
ncbi:MAG TPA: glycosyl hydrolase family 28-related protein [Opitutus sp.]|nr:glycosyl hydrolase family 28-related protein [Opitutus sp.]